MIILKFLLLLLLFGFLAIVVFLLSVWQQVRSGFRRFREQAGEQQTHVDGNVVIDRRSDEEAGKSLYDPEKAKQMLADAGYPDVSIRLAEGRIPCAVAVMRKSDDQP